MGRLRREAGRLEALAGDAGRVVSASLQLTKVSRAATPAPGKKLKLASGIDQMLRPGAGPM